MPQYRSLSALIGTPFATSASTLCIWLADIIFRHTDILTHAAAAMLWAVKDKEQQQDIVFVGAAILDM